MDCLHRHLQQQVQVRRREAVAQVPKTHSSGANLHERRGLSGVKRNLLMTRRYFAALAGRYIIF
jgi:hypothetical protein